MGKFGGLGMDFIANRKISTKLFVSSAISIIFTIIIGFTGYSFLKSANANTNSMYKDRLLAIADLEEAKSACKSINIDRYEFMITTDITRNQQLIELIKENTSLVEQNIDKYSKTKLDPFEVTTLKTFQNNWENAKKASVAIDSLCSQNKNDEAYKLYQSTLMQTDKELIKNLDDLSNYNISVANQLNKANLKKESEVTTILIVLIILAAVVSILISSSTTNMIARPVRSMAVYVQRVADGDLSELALNEMNKVKLHKDEIGVLGKAIIDMRNKLASLVTKVAESSELVAASSEQLSANSEQTSTGSEEISKSVIVIANNTNDQLKSITEAVDITQEISNNIQQAAENAGKTADVAQMTLKATQIGERAIAKTKGQMNNIENTVNGIDQVIKKLGDRSNEIGQIVETIAGLAEQTNLLALNAAIEAARAGEQGRGFAVVADEVRKLAEESQESTKRISDLIEQIQSDTDKAVNAMKSGTNEVKKGMEVVSEAGESFGTISKYVDRITGQIQEISDTTKKIALGSQKVVSAMGQVEISGKEASEQSQSITASVEEQTASMQEIAASSQTLSGIAEGLIVEVNKFKL